MRDNEKRTEAKIIMGIGLLNQTHLNFADVVSDALNFGDVAAMIYIVWLHVVPLNFYPKIKIKLSFDIAYETTVLEIHTRP